MAFVLTGWLSGLIGDAVPPRCRDGWDSRPFVRAVGTTSEVLPLPRRRPPRPESHDDRSAGRVASARWEVGDRLSWPMPIALELLALPEGRRRRAAGGGDGELHGSAECALVAQRPSSALCASRWLNHAACGQPATERDEVVPDGPLAHPLLTRRAMACFRAASWEGGGFHIRYAVAACLPACVLAALTSGGSRRQQTGL